MRAKQASEILGVSVPTVRLWSRQGRLPHTKNAAGQRIYDEQELRLFMGEQPRVEKNEYSRVVGYVRSSSGEQTSLDTQKRILVEQYGELSHVYHDKSSGLNDKRPGLNKLLKDAKNGEFELVVCTHSDRLSRFGVRYIELLLNEYNVKVEYSDTVVKSPEEELMQDFMSLIASFSGKFYRLRGWKEQQKLLNRATEHVTNKQK